MGGFGDNGRIVIEDGRRKRSEENERELKKLIDEGSIGLNKIEEMIGKGKNGVDKKKDRLKKIIGNERFEEVKIEMKMDGGEG